MGEKQDEKESEENMAKRAVVIQFRTDNAHIHAQIRIFSLKNIYNIKETVMEILQTAKKTTVLHS